MSKAEMLMHTVHIECDVMKVFIERHKCWVRLKPIDRDEDAEFDLEVPRDMALLIGRTSNVETVSVALTWRDCLVAGGGP